MFILNMLSIFCPVVIRPASLLPLQTVLPDTVLPWAQSRGLCPVFIFQMFEAQDAHGGSSGTAAPATFKVAPLMLFLFTAGTGQEGSGRDCRWHHPGPGSRCQPGIGKVGEGRQDANTMGGNRQGGDHSAGERAVPSGTTPSEQRVTSGPLRWWTRSQKTTHQLRALGELTWLLRRRPRR